MIEKLVTDLEEKYTDLTIHSVWLVKKTKKDKATKVWHMNKLGKTIVMNLGYGTYTEHNEEVTTVEVAGRPEKNKTDFMSVADGWKVHAMIKNPEDPNFIYCFLDCPVCSPNARYSVLVGNGKYIHRYLTSTAWYQYEFLNAFIALVQHSHHTLVPGYKNSSVQVQMIRTPHPRAIVTSAQVIRLDGITHFVSVVFARGHFAVLVYHLEDKSVIVYDGLKYPLKTWQDHIVHTLKKYGYQELHATVHVEQTVGRDGDSVLELCFNDLYAPWIVYNDPIIKQNDGFNCGPIACLKVLELYGFIPTNSIAGIAQKKHGYRGVVMPFYERMLEVNEPQLKYMLSRDVYVRKMKTIKKNHIKDEEIEIDDGEHEEPDAVSVTSNKRTLAMEKKNRKQQESAKKAMKKCGNAALQSGVAAGAVVSLQVDYRTHSNPEGLVAIVYDFNPRTGGIKVCCQHGVITHDGTKQDYWVPPDKYVLSAPVGMLMPLPDDLAQVREMVEEGRFNHKECPRISYSKMLQLQIAANSPIKKSKGCGCKKGKCGITCGCKRKKEKCHSGCSCNGNCGE